jgi:type VI secretion system protein ImpC
MADQKTAAPASAQVKTEEVSLLDQIVDNVSSSPEPEQRAFARDIVSDFARQVLDGAIVYAKDTESMVKARIAQLDGLISAQLNEVMHAPEFQRLEATWRGLNYLVQQSETGTMLKIKTFNVSKKDLLKDLERASEFDQSAMFKKIYEEEYGVFGGSPFGLLIGDFEFGNHPQDISLLEKMSNIAAAAHAPFIAGADAKMFGLEGYSSLGEPRDLAKIFESVEYAKWIRDMSGCASRTYCSASHTAARRCRSNRSISRRTSTAGITRSICGATPRFRLRPESRTRSRNTDGARPFEGSRAVGWWKGCRPIPFGPMRAISP